MSEPLDRIVAVKVYALLHDPPHKSWCLHALVRGIKCDHEVEARKFRRMVLKDTILEKLNIENFAEKALLADRLAAGLDRWLLTLYKNKWKPVAIARLANMFYPQHSISLELEEDDTNLDWSSLQEGIASFAKSLNTLLKQLNACEELEHIRVMAYNVLFTILEALHYIKRLPISLADTRIPTHTLYDHLYATVSMTNLTILSNGDAPKGFFAVVDIPGIHGFISAARRAGDFWASSWLLSQLAWGTVKEITRYIGMDVLISPTARLNPFVYTTILSFIDDLERKAKERGLSECAESLRSLRQTLKQYFNQLMNLFASSERNPSKLSLDEASLHALIPATIQIVIPKGLKKTNGELILDFTNKHAVIETLKNLYELSWRRIVEDTIGMLEEACNSQDGEVREEDRLGYCILYLILKENLRKILEKPFIGARITVVDAEELYTLLYSCLTGSDNEDCRKVAIVLNSREPNMFENIRNKLKDIAKKYDIRLEELTKNVARLLVFHTAMLLLGKPIVKKVASYTIPVPRPYWYLEKGELNTLIAPSETGWLPCSLCGAEPAVLRLGKRVTESGVEEFRDEDLHFIEEVLEKNRIKNYDRSLISRALKLAGIRPGELLGPYCLFKRILYIVHSRGMEGRRSYRRIIKSTDDIALADYISLLRTILGSNDEIIIEEQCNILLKSNRLRIDESTCRTALAMLLIGREIGIAASLLGVTIGQLRLIMRDALMEIIERKMDIQALGKYLDSILDIKSDPLLSKVWKKIIDTNGQTLAVLLKTLIKRLGRLHTSYVIVRGDADSVSMLHTGRLSRIAGNCLPLTCEEYAKHVINLLETHGSARSSEDKQYVIDALREAYRDICSLLNAIDPDATVFVSPSYKSVLSLALLLTSLHDYTIVKKANGLLVFSGGDDVLAFLPPLRLHETLRFRLVYAGMASNSHIGFHIVNGAPVASAIPFGRSISVRIVELMDIMSEEIDSTTRLLEELAKETEWVLTINNEACKRKCRWRKDALVLSYSRAPVMAILPLRVEIEGRIITIAKEVKTLLRRLEGLLLLGALSPSLPEDYELRYGSIHDTRRIHVIYGKSTRVRQLLNYVTWRNASRRLREITGADTLDNMFNDVSIPLAQGKTIGLVEFMADISSRDFPSLLNVLPIVRVLRVIP